MVPITAVWIAATVLLSVQITETWFSHGQCNSDLHHHFVLTQHGQIRDKQGGVLFVLANLSTRSPWYYLILLHKNNVSQTTTKNLNKITGGEAICYQHESSMSSFNDIEVDWINSQSGWTIMIMTSIGYLMDASKALIDFRASQTFSTFIPDTLILAELLCCDVLILDLQLIHELRSYFDTICSHTCVSWLQESRTCWVCAAERSWHTVWDNWGGLFCDLNRAHSRRYQAFCSMGESLSGYSML